MKHFMFFVVTITGACVLILEIVATRILAPYFGNTIFSFSSIISTILAALSIGYYSGGKISDLYPSKILFFVIIFGSGISVNIFYLLAKIFLPTVGYTLPMIEGSLFVSLVLFFFPCFLLGTISPFAIKLLTVKYTSKKIGNIAGAVFFWSTFGSILGSLLSGFYLIPRFGIDTIMTGVGFVLMSISLLGLVVNKSAMAKNLFLILAVSFAIFNLSPYVIKESKPLFEKDGVYQKITIYDTAYRNSPVRMIIQDKNSSGAMFTTSDELVYDYTKYYEIYKFIKPTITDTLVLGGSASYSIPKALLGESQDISVDVVEIEPSFPLLGRKFFKVPETSRLNTHIQDGRRFLHDSKSAYDLIYSDVYLSLYNVPFHFTTKEFFKLAKNRLKPDGIFIANFIGSFSGQTPSLLLSTMKTLRSEFPNSYLFAVDSPLSTGLQNFILVGVNNKNKVDFSADLAGMQKSRFLESLPEHIVELNKDKLEPHYIFTDNYAPVEFLTAKAGFK